MSALTDAIAHLSRAVSLPRGKRAPLLRAALSALSEAEPRDSIATPGAADRARLAADAAASFVREFPGAARLLATAPPTHPAPTRAQRAEACAATRADLSRYLGGRKIGVMQ